MLHTSAGVLVSDNALEPQFIRVVDSHALL